MYAQTASSLAIHLLMDIHIASIILATVNTAAMNIGVYVSFPVSISLFFGYVPRSGITRSYGQGYIYFCEEPPYFFHSGCIGLHFHRQYTRVSFSPYPHQHLLYMFILMIAILIGVRKYLVMVSISSVEYLFMLFLAICMSSLEKCLLRFFAHILPELFVFWGSMSCL